MIDRRLVKYLCLLVCLWLPPAANALTVTFINPSVQDNSFWGRVVSIARAASHDLNIQLKVLNANSNRQKQFELIKHICESGDKPDFLIFSPWFGNAKRTFELLNTAQIPFVTLERTLREPEQIIVGYPGENYPYWLGEIYHDNIHAGQLLAKTLISKAIDKGNGKENISIIGIGGTPNGESRNRIKGLLNEAKQHEFANVIQTSDANWLKQQSYDVILNMAKRHNHIDIIWAASDDMALGAAQAMADLAHSSVTIGGIDWTSNAISAIKSGKLDASVGGHIMQGAWALIQIFDHQNNMPIFKKGDQPAIYKLSVIESNNIEDYMILAGQPDWHQVDFFKLTRSYSKIRHVPAFSIKAVMSQLNTSP